MCLVLVLLHTAVVAGEDPAAGRWHQLTVDNDAFSGSDNGYSGGAEYSWGYKGFSEFGSERLPAWIHFLTRNLYISDLPDRQRAIAYGIQGQVYTPDDTDSRELVKDDRPYAGLLLWRGTLHAFNDTVSDRLGLQLGVVGPASGGETFQDFFHDLVGSDKANGWDHQLENEPVIRVEAERLWRLGDGSLGGTEFDTIGMAQAGVGNLRSDAGLGLALRVGKNLADTWATASPDVAKMARALPGGRASSWQLFFTLHGSYVANDITIDGNTFEDSHSVSLEHAQALGSLGFAFSRDNWGLLFAYQMGTDEFEDQDYDREFATLSIAYSF